MFFTSGPSYISSSRASNTYPLHQTTDTSSTKPSFLTKIRGSAQALKQRVISLAQPLRSPSEAAQILRAETKDCRFPIVSLQSVVNRVFNQSQDRYDDLQATSQDRKKDSRNLDSDDRAALKQMYKSGHLTSRDCDFLHELSDWHKLSDSSRDFLFDLSEKEYSTPNGRKILLSREERAVLEGICKGRLTSRECDTQERMDLRMLGIEEKLDDRKIEAINREYHCEGTFGYSKKSCVKGPSHMRLGQSTLILLIHKKTGARHYLALDGQVTDQKAGYRKGVETLVIDGQTYSPLPAVGRGNGILSEQQYPPGAYESQRDPSTGVIIRNNRYVGRPSYPNQPNQEAPRFKGNAWSAPEPTTSWEQAYPPPAQYNPRHQGHHDLHQGHLAALSDPRHPKSYAHELVTLNGRQFVLHKPVAHGASRPVYRTSESPISSRPSWSDSDFSGRAPFSQPPQGLSQLASGPFYRSPAAISEQSSICLSSRLSLSESDSSVRAPFSQPPKAPSQSGRPEVPSMVSGRHSLPSLPAADQRRQYPHSSTIHETSLERQASPLLRSGTPRAKDQRESARTDSWRVSTLTELDPRDFDRSPSSSTRNSPKPVRSNGTVLISGFPPPPPPIEVALPNEGPRSADLSKRTEEDPARRSASPTPSGSSSVRRGRQQVDPNDDGIQPAPRIEVAPPPRLAQGAGATHNTTGQGPIVSRRTEAHASIRTPRPGLGNRFLRWISGGRWGNN